MKELTIGLILTVFQASAPLVMAGDNTWSALTQQWNRIQNWQKKQSAHFRALEREAASLTLGVSKDEKSKRATPHYRSYCGRLNE